jgi:hypothetical protein
LKVEHDGSERQGICAQVFGVSIVWIPGHEPQDAMNLSVCTAARCYRKACRVKTHLLYPTNLTNGRVRLQMTLAAIKA